MNTLREAVRDYLDLRRSLGFKLHDAAKLLLKFVAFMEQHRATSITTRLALAWAQQPSTVQAAEWARRLSVVRTFARHRSATDPRTQIPPPGLLPFQPRRARPYLHSEDRDPELTPRRAPNALPLPVWQAATVDLLLPVRIIERIGSTPWRSAQPRTARCRPEGGGADDSRRQVR